MNETLAVVVAAIVILITALVVITIFSGSVQNFSTITDARASCEVIFRSSCLGFGQVPATWDIPNVNVAGQKTSCKAVLTNSGGDCKCDPKGTGWVANCGGAAAPASGPG